MSLSQQLDFLTWHHHDFSTKSRVPIKAGMQGKVLVSDPNHQCKQMQLEIATNGIIIFSTMCPFTFLRWAEPNLPWELSPCTGPMSLNPELHNLQKKRLHGHGTRQLKNPGINWVFCFCFKEIYSKAPISVFYRH